MNADHHAIGGAAVGVLNRMSAWEANLVLNLRLWCEGPEGQAQVWSEYRRSLSGDDAKRECKTFETLVRSIIDSAHRPMVRHEVGCCCVGADEGIFVNLLRTASDGHLRDAALIATLLVGPAHAEQIAMLAGQVGECARKIHKNSTEYPTQAPPAGILLH
ncbi:MAG: hypothetical protein AAF296_13635 [Pseudomonadota bacterium]